MAPPPGREEGKVDVVAGYGRNIKNNDAVQHTVEGGGEQGEEVEKVWTGPGRRRVVVRPSVKTYSAFLAVVRPDGAGGLCLGERRVRFRSEVTARLVNERQDQRWQQLSQLYPPCPDVPPRAGRTTAPEVATDYWRVTGEDLLDVPRPVIAPGWMLPGKRAYLEANVGLTDRFTHPTPLGELVIDVRGEVFVDWGDASPQEGPFTTAGRAWPQGGIDHFWTDRGRYDVVVTVRWTADWRLGAQGGRLDDLATQAVVEDFEIRPLEAVRNR